MIRLTITVDKPVGQAIGIKEDIAMYLERFGDTRVVNVEEIAPVAVQMTLEPQHPAVRIVKG